MEYENTVYISFEDNHSMADLFAANLNTKRILTGGFILSAIFETSITFTSNHIGKNYINLPLWLTSVQPSTHI